MLPRFGTGDAPIEPLLGRTVVVFGYGNQGRAQALNLRDSCVDVRVALREGSRGAAAAHADGLACVGLHEGAALAEVAALLVPDDAMPELVQELRTGFRPGVVLLIAHGANAARGRVKAPAGGGLVCVAPAGPGVQVRERFLAGGGVTAFLALSDPADARLRSLGLAYGAAIGCARAGIYECTFAQETDVDLFGEQAVLCGGLGALLTTAFDTLVAVGYPAEMAYLECVHQVNLTARLIHEGGLEGMRDRISPAALLGDLTRGPRIAQALQPVFEEILQDIRSGAFEREQDEAASGGPAEMARLRAAARHAGLEATRRELGL